jgi:hypothetical protein
MEKVAGRGSPPGSAPREAPTAELVTVCAECKQVIGLHGPSGRPTPGPSGGETLVSHGICEACARRLYGSIFNRRA